MNQFKKKETGVCIGFNDVLDKYNQVLKTVKLSGPTNFAPLIKETIRIVKETQQVRYTPPSVILWHEK